MLFHGLFKLICTQTIVGMFSGKLECAAKVSSGERAVEIAIKENGSNNVG